MKGVVLEGRFSGKGLDIVVTGSGGRGLPVAGGEGMEFPCSG